VLVNRSLYCREAAQLMGRYVVINSRLIKTQILKVTSATIVLQAVTILSCEWTEWVVTLQTPSNVYCSEL
jgi:hypothetical protein